MFSEALRSNMQYYGMKAEIKEDGLCYLDDGTIIDPSQLKEQLCSFCENPESTLTEETCCTGCSKLVK